MYRTISLFIRISTIIALAAWGAALSACSTPAPSTPLTEADLTDLAIEHIYISLDEPLFFKLQEKEPSLSGQPLDEARIVTTMKKSFDTELKAAAQYYPRGVRATTLDVRITRIDEAGPPYAMDAVAYLSDAQNGQQIVTYRLSSTYGKGGMFEKIGQSMANTFSDADVLERLSGEMAHRLRAHLYPASVN